MSIKVLGSLFLKKLSIKGFVKGKKIESLLNKYFELKDIKDIKDVPMPLAIPTVNLKTGEVVYFTNSENIEESESCDPETDENCDMEINENEINPINQYKANFFDDKETYIKHGKLCEIARASASFPGVFIPKKINSKQYIDGGVRVNTPVEVLKKMGADKVIAITFDCNKKYNVGIKNIVGISEQAFNILSHAATYEEQSLADVNVRLCLNNVSLLDFSNPVYVAKRGYNIIARNISEIKRRLEI